MKLLGKTKSHPKMCLNLLSHIFMQNFLGNLLRPLGMLVKIGGLSPQVPNNIRWKPEEVCICIFIHIQEIHGNL